MKVVIVILSVCLAVWARNSPCDLRAVPSGFVCVCNATYCDYFEGVVPNAIDEYLIVSSSKDGLRFSKKSGPIIKYISSDFIDSGKFTNMSESVEITVDRETTYQDIVGFGGAVTGAVAHNLNLMSADVRDLVYKSFYSEQGIGYSMMRYTIGGCDFDLGPWAYNEYPVKDDTLSNFTALDWRDDIKISIINRLREITNNYDIKFLGAAWSPPPWMKSNNKWTGFSRLKTEYYQTWAEYHLRFLELMHNRGIDFWGISTGNEPNNGAKNFAFVDFMSLGWTPSNQAIYLADHFGPLLRNSKFSHVKIIGNEDQRPTYPSWFEKMSATRPKSVDYLDVLGVHWYLDDFASANVYDETHKIFPKKPIINTESCAGAKPIEIRGPVLGSWHRAEFYVKSFMTDMKHWLGGWVDWNIALNEEGGPNYVNNRVDAPIILNTTNGQEFYKQPIFYAIGHFSKFLPEGSVRVNSVVQDGNIDHNVSVISFIRPDGYVVVILLNSGDDSVPVAINDDKTGRIRLKIPGRSLHTIVY